MDPLANGALCLSTPKYNGKSGTGQIDILVTWMSYNNDSKNIHVHCILIDEGHDIKQIDRI